VLWGIRAGPSFGAEISGEPRIIDGDTVEIGHIKIRFAGIDALKLIRYASIPKAIGGNAALPH
jgi:endonuclease YncB( thermonuclease family)